MVILPHLGLCIIKIRRLILRPVSQDSPGSVSSGGDPRRKISKAVARDTNHRNRPGVGERFFGAAAGI